MTLDQPCEGFRTLEVMILTGKDSMSDTYVGAVETVSFPADVKSYQDNAYAVDVGIIYEQQSNHNMVSVSALSGTTLTMRAKDSIISRVIGYK